MDRQQGHYWVKHAVDSGLEVWWKVGWFIHGVGWMLCGSSHIYQDDFFAEIDERRLRRADPDVNPEHLYTGPEGARG